MVSPESNHHQVHSEARDYNEALFARTRDELALDVGFVALASMTGGLLMPDFHPLPEAPIERQAGTERQRALLASASFGNISLYEELRAASPSPLVIDARAALGYADLTQAA